MLYSLDQTLVAVLVLAVWAAGYCLVAIWAGVAKWPAWYFRVGAMCAAVGLLFPLEAYEPATLFLLVMPLVALGAFWTCRKKVEAASEPATAPGGWRFSLRDLMLAILLSGLVSAMLAVLWRKQDTSGMVGLVGLAAGLSALAVFSAALVAGGRSRWIFGLALVVSLGVLIAGHSYLSPHVLGLNYVLMLETLPKIIVHCLLAYVVFSGLLMTAVLLAPRAFGERVKSSDSPSGRRSLARGILVFGGIALAAPLLAVYWWMLEKPPFPENPYPAENSLPRVLALINEAKRLNVTEAAVVETGDAADPEMASRLASLYRQMETALADDGYVSWTWPELPIFSVPPEIQVIRGQGRAWHAEANWAASQDRFDDASRYSLMSTRLGSSYTRGGTLIQSLVGVAVEGIGVSKLIEIRGDVSHDRARELIVQLERIDGFREELDLTCARDAALVDRTLGWRCRLALAIPRLLGRRYADAGPQAARFAMQRRDALLRLLMTELAIRVYREEHGNLPETISDLVPHLLSTIPLDPFSGRPLVYKRTPEGYLLYSVWIDGVDDGGYFVTGPAQWATPGFDMDVDLHKRMSAAPAGS